MDLRKQKTLRAIREAFLTLRRQKNLEAISVTELVALAEISKATFYLHYRDIYDLSEKLQQEILESVVARLKDPMDSLKDPKRFMYSFAGAVEAEADLISTVFSGSQTGALPVQILKILKESIFANAPELKNDPKVQVFLTYHIMGGYYACMESGESDYKKVLKILETLQPQLPVLSGV